MVSTPVLTPRESPVEVPTHLKLPPSKWDVFTTIRRTQLQVRLTWISATVERGPIIGVANSSWVNLVDGEVIEYLDYSNFILDEVSGLTTIIPSFDVYARYWARAEMINPFSFHFWHNSLTLQNSRWFLKYYDDVMATLDEQIIIWGADEYTRNSKIYNEIVTYIEALRLFIHVL